MAVAHDFASESHTGSVGSISEAQFSWSHNPVGTPRGVLVFVVNLVSDGDNVSSVTYDGAAVPFVENSIATDISGEAGLCAAYFLGSGVPTTDPATVVVNRANTANELWAVAITVTAAADTATTGIVKLEGDGTLAEQNVDDGSPGTNSMRYAAGFSGLASFPPTGASSTALHDFDTGQQTAAAVRETTAGQGSRPVGFSSGTTDDRAFVHLAIKEAAAAASLLWNPNIPTIARI